jgi:HAD superfamily hydrolase (TIGR01509 family)
MSGNIRAVLFDLDGVLVETRKLHYDAFSRALSEIGIELSFDEHQKLYNGLPTYKKIQLLAEKHSFSAEQIDQLNQTKQNYTQELLAGRIIPNSEHEKIFLFLHQKNIKVAVCSNTKRSTLDFILRHLQIQHHLSFSLSNDDIKEPKPSPEIYLLAMQRLGVKPSETLVFEDSPHGLESARKAGAVVEAVSGTEDITLEKMRTLLL